MGGEPRPAVNGGNISKYSTSVTYTEGKIGQYKSCPVATGLKVTISKNFTASKPSTGSTLSCNITQNGTAYTGAAYVDWRYYDSGKRLSDNSIIENALWGTGNTYTFSQDMVSKSGDYAVYCYVALENGVKVRSNVIYLDGTQAPAPPNGLTVSKYSGSQYKVSWDAQADHYYNLQSSTNGTNYSTIADSADYPEKIKTDGNRKYFIIDSLTSGKTYYFKVQSRNANGRTGLFSEPVIITIGSIAAPSSLTAVSVGQCQIKLTWNAGGGASSYNIYRNSGSGYVKITNVLDTSYVDSGLNSGQAYTYMVKSVSAGGIESSQGSPEATATASNEKISVSNFALEYDSKWIYDGNAISPFVIVTYGGEELEEGEEYDISFANNVDVGRASINITGKGSYTGTLSKYFYIVPRAPSNVSTKLYGCDDVNVSWPKSTGASGYYIYYKKSTSFTYTYFAKTSSLYTKKANLSDGVTYDFKVVPYASISGSNYKSIGYNTDSIRTLKKVSRGKIYYYKVRAYETVDGKRIYAPWSTTRAYKLK